MRHDEERGDDEIGRLLRAARPEPVRLPPEKEHALFERALAASGKGPGRRKPWLLFGLAGPVAAAAAVVSGMWWRPAPTEAPRGTGPAAQRTATSQPPSLPATAEAAGATRRVPQMTVAAAAVVQHEGAADASPALRRKGRPSSSRAAATPRPIRHRLRRPSVLLARADVTRPPVADVNREQTVAVTKDAPAPEVATGAAPVSPPAADAAPSLLVVVTSAPPRLEVAVREAPADEAPGFAQAAALRLDANEQPVWAECTLSENRNPEVVLLALREATSDPGAARKE